MKSIKISTMVLATVVLLAGVILYIDIDTAAAGQLSNHEMARIIGKCPCDCTGTVKMTDCDDQSSYSATCGEQGCASCNAARDYYGEYQDCHGSGANMECHEGSSQPCYTEYACSITEKQNRKCDDEEPNPTYNCDTEDVGKTCDDCQGGTGTTVGSIEDDQCISC